MDTQQTVADILLADKIITPEQYSQVKLAGINTNRNISELLIEQKLASLTQVAEAKAKLLNVPFVALSARAVNPAALALVPEPVAKRFTILPFDFDKKTNTLSVAMANPEDLATVEFLKQRSAAQVVVYAASPDELRQMIDQHYAQDIISEVKEAVKETEVEPGTKTITQTDLAQIIKEAPIARIVSTVLEYAIKSRASDVHIEPMEGRTRVRYRIDGILHEKLSLPKGIHDALVSRIKILSGMKIDEHRIPQDGRFNFKMPEEEVDLRISVLPSVLGEKIVMRLLKKSGGVPSLPELGLNGISLKNLETAILRPHGIIIVCGPTGSGKTTTLYSVLNKLNTTKVNILTLEDPVEYRIAGVNQVQINPAVGLTFATGLRSFLRQDPNIILVGEIRDRETTDLAIQAALTGHLVFSTLHTSNASGALPRLLDLGAETFLLASTMNAVVGQRIVRKMCTACREQYEIPESMRQDIRNVLGPLLPSNKTIDKLWRGRGCDECNNTGYLGRVGIFEVLPMTEKIARMVLERADAGSVEKEAVAQSMITMKQDGYLKVIEGVTTIEEVLRVAQE
ncbi:Flp pilus assembly complex ATPase component TadA [Candidatus Microgenomates bacterium]|nr:Flp pilus assembly complex ATPase component TadA [Candidatus Microgenomates bacterium]